MCALQLVQRVPVQSTLDGAQLMPMLKGLGIPPGKVRCTSRGPSLRAHTRLLFQLRSLVPKLPTHSLTNPFNLTPPITHPTPSRSAGSCWISQQGSACCRPPRCRRARCGGRCGCAVGRAGLCWAQRQRRTQLPTPPSPNGTMQRSATPPLPPCLQVGCCMVDADGSPVREADLWESGQANRGWALHFLLPTQARARSGWPPRLLLLLSRAAVHAACWLGV